MKPYRDACVIVREMPCRVEPETYEQVLKRVDETVNRIMNGALHPETKVFGGDYEETVPKGICSCKNAAILGYVVSPPPHNAYDHFHVFQCAKCGATFEDEYELW